MLKFLLNFYYYFFKKRVELVLPPKKEPSQFLINLAKMKERVENPTLSERERHNLNVLMNELIPEKFENAYVSHMNYFHISSNDLMKHKSSKADISGVSFNLSWNTIKIEALRQLSREGIKFSAGEELTFETSTLVEKIKTITIPPEKIEEEKEMTINSIGLYR